MLTKHTKSGFLGAPEVKHMIDYPHDFFSMVVHNNFTEELERYCALAKRTLCKLGMDSELSLDDDAPPIAVEAAGVLRLRAQLEMIEAWEFGPLLHHFAVNGAPILTPHILRLMEVAMRIGALGERLKARRHESDAARGEKVLRSAKQGNEQVHGTPEEKRRRYDMYQEEVNRLSSLHPDAKKTDIAHRVARKFQARKFQVSYKTILRHTEVPKQRK